MKRFVLALVLVLAMAGFAMADSWHNQYNTTNNQTYNQPTANATATGGAGGSATLTDNSKTYNTNTNLNSNSNKNENTNVNINEGNRQSQGQLQGQMQGQMQGQINEGNSVSIVNERAYLGAVSTNQAELNFGQGVMDWKFASYFLKFGIPDYKGENILKLDKSDANVRAKSLIATVLKMKEKEGTLCSNVRLIIVRKGAQKSYQLSLVGTPAASGVIGTTGGAASAVVGPSFAGTKVNDLFDIYFVKINWKDCK